MSSDLAEGRFTLNDVGTGAVIGGLLGELCTRLAPSIGREWQVDGWREGMFFGALAVLVFWVFGELGA
jgi:hypothetical protein